VPTITARAPQGRIAPQKAIAFRKHGRISRELQKI
jgi:hypothetical protein